MRGIRIPETKRSRELRRNATSAERKIWAALRNRQCGGHKFVRQERIGPFYADFVCRERKLVVEIDGATHSTEAELAHDARRAAFLAAEGYRVLRFTNAAVYDETDGVLETIFRAVEGEVASDARQPPLSPLSRGEVR